MHYSYHIIYKASKYKAVYMVYIFSRLPLQLVLNLSFSTDIINYLPAKAYGHSVRLFVVLQLLILLWFGG